MNVVLALFVFLLFAFVVSVVGAVLVSAGEEDTEPAQDTGDPDTTPDDPDPEQPTQTDPDTVDELATARTAVAQDGGAAHQDPVSFDDPLALYRRGWQQVPSDESDLVTGEFEANGTTRPGAIKRTPSGRVKVYVKNPPRRMQRRAHNGRCLRPPDGIDHLDADDGWRKVHFSQNPETFMDSIDYIQELME